MWGGGGCLCSAYVKMEPIAHASKHGHEMHPRLSDSPVVSTCMASSSYIMHCMFV